MSKQAAPVRDASDRNAAILLGTAIAVAAYAYLGWWSNDVMAYDPKPTNAIAPHLLSPIAKLVGPAGASLLGGLAAGGLVYWLGPIITREETAE